MELECLAIVNAIQKCHYYLAGITRFEVWTDHRPLVGAFEKYLHLLQNQRLMRMREKLTSYNFSVIWTPGKSHYIADALSRAPVFGPCKMMLEPEHLECCLRIFDASLTRMDMTADVRYMDTMQFLKSGKHATTIDKDCGAYDYRKVIDQLCIETYQGEEVLVLDGCRLVVPTHKCDTIHALLHAGHSGIAKTYRTATQLYYCPNMIKNIERSVAACTPCQEQRQSSPRQSMGEVNLPCYTQHAACSPQ